MKKHFAVNLLILILVLSSGCQKSPETVGSPTVKAPTATTVPAVILEPSPTVAEKVMTLEEKVDAFRSGKIDFPTDMTPEQYSAFVDGMNDLVGRKPIYVEAVDNTGAKVVLYFDITTNRMVQLKGSYAENKALIDQNILEVFVKISKELGTGNIQFINSSGELVTSPNSADVDWNLRVDETNYKDGLIDLPTILNSKNPDGWWDKVIGGISLSNPAKKRILVPGILMDDTVSRVVSNQNGWNQYPTLDIIFIRTDKEGNPIYGVRTMVGPDPSTFLGYESGTLDIKPGRYELRDSDTIDEFEVGAVYYVGLTKNQQLVWDENNQADIDELQGTDSESNSFDNAINQNMPDDGNIILAGTLFIKKK